MLSKELQHIKINVKIFEMTRCHPYNNHSILEKLFSKNGKNVHISKPFRFYYVKEVYPLKASTMKRILKASLLIAVIVCMSFVSGNAQVVVKIKPNKPKLLVIKPNKHKDGHAWRAGHWKWHKKNNKYTWVKAHWAKQNKGHHWTVGRWVKNSNGHSWVPGHWKKGKAQKLNKKKKHKKHHH